MELCSFYCAESLYAVPVLAVEEIFRPMSITPVPGTDARVAGLLNRRGISASVLDLSRCLTSQNASRDGKRYAGSNSEVNCGCMILLVSDVALVDDARRRNIHTFREPVVLMVDRMGPIVHVTEDNRYPVPPHAADKCIYELVKYDHIYCALLDVVRLAEEILSSDCTLDGRSEGDSDEYTTH